MTKRINLNLSIAIGAMVFAIAALFVSTPTNGDFGWYESSRNALSGAFVNDLIMEMPFSDPIGWAEDYYAKYPALVILFYPPFLHVCLGLGALLFGVSHLSAVLTMFAFYTALMFGVYALARRMFDPLAAAGVALAYCMSPVIATWARQIMHEIPMMALVVWSMWFGLKYMDEERPGDLFAMAFLGMCALYTKQTAIFVILAFGVYLLLVKGLGVLRRRHVVLTLVCSMVALVPLLVIQLKFASFNAVSLFAHPNGVSADTMEGVTWYLARLPGALGWPLAVAAGLFSLWSLILVKKKHFSREGVFMLLWFLVTYAAFTLILLKNVRHGIPIYLPVVFASVGFFWSLPLGKWRSWTPFAVGIATAVATLYLVPAERDIGYAEVAELVAHEAPENAVVLFAGHKDGDFIYNIRAHDERGDINILRADKLFLDIEILPSLGLNAKQIGMAEIEDLLTRYGVSYVVSDERSFLDAEVIQKLMSLLHSDKFEKIHTVDVTGFPSAFAGVDRLIIYKNLAALPPIPEKPGLKVLTGRNIED